MPVFFDASCPKCGSQIGPIAVELTIGDAISNPSGRLIVNIESSLARGEDGSLLADAVWGEHKKACIATPHG